MHARKVKILYKSILKLHRGLPKEIQELGNDYVKSEFKRHINLSLEKDKQIITTFMWEWTNYAINLAHQLGIKGIQGEERLGKSLKEDQLEQFNDEQITQLHELYIASKGEKKKDS